MSGARREYCLIPYDDEHRADVVRLRNLFVGISELWNEEHLRWQQEQNPSFDEHLIYLASWRNRIVGMRVLQPMQWEVGDPPERFRAPCFSGTAFEPDHQNRGIFGMLTRFAEEDLAKRGYEYVFNLSAGPATYVSSLAAGWRAIGPLQPMIRQPRIQGTSLLQRAARMSLRLTNRPRRNFGAARLRGDLRCGEVARLEASSRRDGRIRFVRDEVTLRWRLRDPSSRYVSLELERGGRFRGHLTLHRRAPPIPHGPLNISDWSCAGAEHWEQLLDAAIHYSEAIQQPLVIWTATLADWQRDLLRASGFADEEAGGAVGASLPTLLVRRLGPKAEAAEWTLRGRRIDRAENWDLRMIESDAF